LRPTNVSICSCEINLEFGVLQSLISRLRHWFDALPFELCNQAIFNAVINAWARSREKIAPVRAEQILNWMQNLGDLDIQPDKYTFNTVRIFNS
jgi:hypothetical protein